MALHPQTLVFGGSYFIGRRSVELLREAGHDVFVLNRGTRPAPYGVTQLVADRDDAAALARALAGRHFDVVVDYSCYDGGQAERALAALSDRFRHWVHISTAAVYSDTAQLPVVETSPTGGQSAWGAYGREKSEAEKALRASAYASQITILRPSYLYGPGNNLDREQFLWKRLLRGRPLLVPGAGENVIQFLHVDDLGHALLAILAKPSLTSGESYNVGEVQAITAKGWVHAAARAAGVEPRIVEVPTGTLGLIPRAFFPMRDLDLFLDVHKLLALGFRPRFELATGLAQTLESYDARELTNVELDLTTEDRVLSVLGERAVTLA
jgi:dTDP-glucose 4,6-dehydratase